MQIALALVALSVFASGIEAQAATAPAPTAASAGTVAVRGKMLVDAAGARLGSVDRVDADGSAEIIIDGHVAVVPATTLSMVNGKLTTSLKKDQIIG